MIVRKDDAEIDGEAGEKREEGFLLKLETFIAFDVDAGGAADPADEAEEGCAGGLRTFEEGEFGRRHRFDGAELGCCGGEFLVEDDRPSNSLGPRRERVGAAGDGPDRGRSRRRAG